MSPAAKKVFDTLPAPTQVHVATAVQGLSHDPRPEGAKRKPGAGERWRLGVDDVVLVYDIDDAAKTVLVVRIKA